MKKTYTSPKAEEICFATEELLAPSGNPILTDSNEATNTPVTDFGNVSLW